MKAKKEEELEEVKRRAAEEALKARLEREKMEVDVEKEDEEVKLKDEGQQEVNYLTTQEEKQTKEEAKEWVRTASKVDKKGGVKTEGNYYDFFCKILDSFTQSSLKSLATSAL